VFGPPKSSAVAMEGGGRLREASGSRLCTLFEPGDAETKEAPVPHDGDIRMQFGSRLEHMVN